MKINKKSISIGLNNFIWHTKYVDFEKVVPTKLIKVNDRFHYYFDDSDDVLGKYTAEIYLENPRKCHRDFDDFNTVYFDGKGDLFNLEKFNDNAVKLKSKFGDPIEFRVYESNDIMGKSLWVVEDSVVDYFTFDRMGEVVVLMIREIKSYIKHEKMSSQYMNMPNQIINKIELLSRS